MRNDLTGRRFGRLTPIRFLGRKNGKSQWLCQCDCGVEKVVQSTNLISGNTKSCGCLKSEAGSAKRKDITGRRFGRLTAVKFVGVVNKRTRWLCKCDCGNEATVTRGNLISGYVMSCGCLRSEITAIRSFRHGKSHSPLYNVWSGMLARCANPNSGEYRHYGGRGITVCDEWKDFSAFNDWAMAAGYDRNLQIDRINVNGNYEPSNCRWVTAKENQNNRRSNLLITIDSETKTLQQWADLTGIRRETISKRMKYGFSGRDLIAEVGTIKGKARCVS